MVVVMSGLSPVKLLLLRAIAMDKIDMPSVLSSCNVLQRLAAYCSVDEQRNPFISWEQCRTTSRGRESVQTALNLLGIVTTESDAFSCSLLQSLRRTKALPAEESRFGVPRLRDITSVFVCKREFAAMYAEHDWHQHQPFMTFIIKETK